MIYSMPRAKIYTGEELKRLTDETSEMKERFMLKGIYNKFKKGCGHKVFALCGLRRTGKTTMMKQMARKLLLENDNSAMYIKCDDGCDLYDLESKIHEVLDDNQTIHYCFIDEATNIDNIIQDGSILSDETAAFVNIMLAGTNSLVFKIAMSNELLDRVYLYDMTFISYAEQAYILNMNNVDDYIRYGGLLSESGRNYNADFSRYVYNEYTNSAIGMNIVKSLWMDREGYNMPVSLLNVRYSDEVSAGFITKVVNDRLHRSDIKILSESIKFQDLGIARKKLKEILGVTMPLAERDEIKKFAMTELHISDCDVDNVTDQLARWVDKYLRELGFLINIDELTCDRNGHSVSRRQRSILLQPGIRYGIAEALIKAVSDNKSFSLKEQILVKEKLEESALGFLLEDVILGNTEMFNESPNDKVCVFSVNPIGEFDMLVYRYNDKACHLYEIKHSKEVAFNEQTVYLRNSQLTGIIENTVAPVASRTVLYRGETRMIEGIQYKNVEEYLLELVKDGSTPVFKGVRRAKFI